jgi:hypothetical protein
VHQNDNAAVDERIASIRRKCSQLWNCPKTLRQAPKHMELSVDVFASNILRPYPECKLSVMPVKLLSILQNGFYNCNHMISFGRYSSKS